MQASAPTLNNKASGLVSREALHQISERIRLGQPSSLYRWTTGECHEFALALAECLIHDHAMTPESLEISVGTRFFHDDVTDAESCKFTHAVLRCQTLEGAIAHVDCYGIDAVEDWEQRFLLEEWALDKHDRSVFDWKEVPATSPEAVSALVFEIDGSRPVDPVNISFALQAIRSAIVGLDLTSHQSPVEGIDASRPRPRLG